ncbi:MAG: flagellar hook-length control protein FliK [Planctomycetota bacterium]
MSAFDLLPLPPIDRADPLPTPTLRGADAAGRGDGEPSDFERSLTEAGVRREPAEATDPPPPDAEPAASTGDTEPGAVEAETTRDELAEPEAISENAEPGTVDPTDDTKAPADEAPPAEALVELVDDLVEAFEAFVASTSALPGNASAGNRASADGQTLPGFPGLNALVEVLRNASAQNATPRQTGPVIPATGNATPTGSPSVTPTAAATGNTEAEPSPNANANSLTVAETRPTDANAARGSTIDTAARPATTNANALTPTLNPSLPTAPAGNAPASVTANPLNPANAAPAGQSATTTATSPTDALNAARINRGLANAVNQQGGNVTLRLTPPEMGTVRIQLNLQGTAVSAQFHAETDAAQRLLTQQLGQLRASLESQGLQVERLGVQALGGSSNASNLQQQTNGDANQNPNQANADGRSRGQNQNQNSDQSPGQPEPETFDDLFRDNAEATLTSDAQRRG